MTDDEELTSDHYSSVGDAFQALGFRQCVNDQRKFVYVCRVFEGLLNHKYSHGLQKQLYTAMGEAVDKALETELNVHVAKKLVHLVKEQLAKEKHAFYFMYPYLWEERLDKVMEWQGKLSQFRIEKLCLGVSKASLHITDLPDDCLRMIFRRLSDHRDICRLAQVNRRFHKLCGETNLWRDLSKFHLSESQLESIDSNRRSNWKDTFKSLIRKSTLRECYGDMIHLCSHCRYLFWKHSTHPCTYDASVPTEMPPSYIPLTPRGFLDLFRR